MAKFKTLPLQNKNKAGNVISHRFQIHVNADGWFYTNIPESMESGLDSQIGAEYSNRAKAYQVHAQSFSKLEEQLNRLLQNLNAVTITVQNVIQYNIESHVSFGLDEDGEIVPNGYYSKTKEHSVWLDREESLKYGSHHYSDRSVGGYSLIVGAQAMTKTTYTYGDKSESKYEPYYKDEGHHGIDNPAQRLNSWCGFSLRGTPKEIPYTDEAAIFFFDLMMGMAKLSKLVQDRTFNQEDLIKTIQSSSGALLGFSSKK